MTEADRRSGIAAALAAYVLWGLMPVYIKLAEGVPALDVLAHRVFWAAATLLLVIAALRAWPPVRAALRNPRLLGWLLFSAAMIGANWYLYTWSVLAGRVLDTSLGYFIQPLFNTALGVILLKERLTRWQWIAIALAIIGIGVMTAALGGLPLVSIGLAAAFGLYSFARNRAAVDALTGLFIETLLLAPLALWWLLQTPEGLFGHGWPLALVLVASGAVTCVPLGLFGHAARRISLSALGFLQYIAPSIVFLLGVFVYGEAMDGWRLTAFIFIWLGLAAFSYGGLRERKAAAAR
ncbi:MAG: EamA family transporter RarD [Pacificimonas sp.]|jgi:chloramphenicol-sensitive protein RarD|nr:EamA family transporter RarD [Pacificimonas sp.]